MTDNSPFALRVTGPMGSWIHRLSKGRTIVGRTKTADVEISEIFAAPNHCALDWDERLACHVLSVWGPNGVSVDGTFLPEESESRPLSTGDELRLGDVSLRYERSHEHPGIAV
jgi:predicted component of type VI protein secretion system